MHPCGGAIALGHPIGATGGKILATLICSLKAQKKEIGILSACIGGGQRVAMVLRNSNSGGLYTCRQNMGELGFRGSPAFASHSIAGS
jgi:hypothetical protein